ncbi:glycosyl transferase [Metarhizium anisopliae]
MLISPRFLRLRPRVLLFSGVVFAVIVFTLFSRSSGPRFLDQASIRRQFPLAWEHIQQFHQLNRTAGGAWFVPPSWQGDHPEPENILDAAKFASEAAKLSPQRQVPFSNIPLVVHQKWNDVDLSRLNSHLLGYIERWLEYSVSANDTFREMAYFFWADDGVASLVDRYEPDFVQDFETMFSRVEKVDIFRVLVCKWFGGIYGDVDTVPLKHPADWIQKEDITQWIDEETGKTYGKKLPTGDGADAKLANTRPVNLLWGLEADTDPNTNQYWRMGYSHPVQLTNWAMASARQHPILHRFLDRLKDKLVTEKQAALQAEDGEKPKAHDPLTRTGPAAVTEATIAWLQKQVGLRWNALTGLKDGGRSKLASDVLVLPITGFSPGRGSFGNMGSKPYTDPDARLAHHAMGSWHKFDARVEYGKFCRTFFGMCKDWSKMPS